MPEIDTGKLKRFLADNRTSLLFVAIAFLVLGCSLFLYVGEKRKVDDLELQVISLKRQITAKKTELDSLKRDYRKGVERIERMKAFFTSGSLTDKPEEIVKNIYTVSRKLGVDFGNFTSTLKDGYLTVDFSASGKERNVLELLSKIFRTYPITVESLSLSKPKLKLYLRLKFKILMGKFPKAVSGA